MNTNNWHILIISEDDNTFTLLSGLLANLDAHTAAAERVRCFDEGLSAIRGSQWDAVLLVDRAGDGRGVELVRQVFAHEPDGGSPEGGPPIGEPPPVLVIGAPGSYALDVEAMRAGSSGYLEAAELTLPLLERTIRYTIQQRRSAGRTSGAQHETSTAHANALDEETHQQDHANLVEALSGMTDAYVALDRDWRFIAVNEIAQREFLDNRPIDEVMGIRIWDLYPNTRGDLFYQRFHESVKTGRPQHFEAFSSLNQKWYEVHCYPRDGRLDIYHREITHRKQAEQDREWLLEQISTQAILLEQQKRELENRNQQLQGMFEHAPAGMALFDAEPPYQVLASNLVYQRIWPEEFQKEGLAGRYLSEFIPDAEAHGVLPIFREVAETGQGKTLYHFPFDGIPARGRTWWDWDLSPVFEEGRLTAFVLVAFDVTNEVKARQQMEQELVVRQRFEEALWASENRLRRLIDSNIIGIFFANVEGQVTDANEAFLRTVGCDQDDLQNGRINWRAMTPEEYSEVDQRGIEEARRLGACMPYEKEYFRKDGSRVPVLFGYAHFEGSVTDFICFLLDLSELKQAEDQARHYAAELERSNRDLQDFAFIASHDLQEPLRKIIAFGGRLQQKYDGVLDAEGLDYLKRMREAAQRMQNMIQDLLAYSRVSTQGLPFTQVDLNAVARDVLSDLEMRIEQSSGTVQIGPLPVIEADYRQIQHLLQNLINNALKFHRPDVPPQVTLSAAKVGKYIELRVEDNGIGFDETHLERIFQPFQRLHGRSEYEGSGMGLAICRKIAERHGGSITASGQPGQGSTFIIRLPVNQG